MILSADPEPEIQAFLSEHAIVPDQTVNVSLRRVGVRATPTVLVIDSKGRVERSFVGQLSPNSGEDVRHLVATIVLPQSSGVVRAK